VRLGTVEYDQLHLLRAAVEDVVGLDVFEGRAADEIDGIGQSFDAAMVVPAEHGGVLDDEARVVVAEAGHAARVRQADEEFLGAEVVRGRVVEILEQDERRAERVVDVADGLGDAFVVAQAARRDGLDAVEVVGQVFEDVVERLAATSSSAARSSRRR
jgi:hypothetical protein